VVARTTGRMIRGQGMDGFSALPREPERPAPELGVGSKPDGAEAAEQFSETPADEEVELEAASGLEPESRGFAGRKDGPDQVSPNPVKLDDPGL